MQQTYTIQFKAKLAENKPVNNEAEGRVTLKPVPTNEKTGKDGKKKDGCC